MADETITQPAPVVEAPVVSPAQERITQLSEKVRQEGEARTAAEVKATDAERRATFAEGFIDVVSANPVAKDFKADIQAKVMSGMSVQDATFAVLGAAGKLGNTPAPEVPSPAGGSATTQLPANGGAKTPAEMTQAERRAQLEKDIHWT